MRLPLSAHRARARHARLACPTAVLLLLAPSAAHATHYLVSAAGGGDFATVQAAVNADAIAPRDSILIAAGTYPESVTIPVDQKAAGVQIVAVAGGTVTLHSIVSVGTSLFVPTCGLSGLTFDQPVDWGARGADMAAANCVFERGLADSSANPGRVPNLADCEFRGPVRLFGWPFAFAGLRFMGAPLVTGSGDDGDLTFRDCTFEGPADDLVTASGRSDEAMVFDHCEFAGAGTGIHLLDRHGLAGLRVRSCRFHDLASNGIAFEAPPGSIPRDPFGDFFQIFNSRFDRCGTAVRWIDTFEGMGSGMAMDSVYASTSDALIVPGASYDNLVVEGSGGNGMVVRRTLLCPQEPSNPPMGMRGLQIRHSRFAGNAGAGVTVSDTLVGNANNGFRILSTLADDQAVENGDAGFDLEGAYWHAGHCIARDNGGDGLRFTSVESGFDDMVGSCTFAGNRGAGLRWLRARTGGAEPQSSDHDLATRNGEGGIVAAPTGPGRIAFNDAWKNRHGDFVNAPSPADSNLSADPEFCRDALTLVFGSPCGAGGVYGLIGAEPEVCGGKGRAEIAGDAPAAAPPVAFAVQPNPARGAVEFTLPPGPGGRIEVLDLQGRRVWSSAVGGGAMARWDGRTAAGSARPGLYLARLSRPDGVQLVRFVWTR